MRLDRRPAGYKSSLVVVTRTPSLKDSARLYACPRSPPVVCRGTNIHGHAWGSFAAVAFHHRLGDPVGSDTVRAIAVHVIFVGMFYYDIGHCCVKSVVRGLFIRFRK